MQFQIKGLMYFTLVVCLFFTAKTFYLNSVYHPRWPTSVRCLRVQLANELTYRVKGVAVSEFRDWIGESTPGSKANGQVALRVTVELYYDEDKTIEFVTSPRENDDVFFKWDDGYWRKGSLEELKRLLKEPQFFWPEANPEIHGEQYSVDPVSGNVYKKTQFLDTSNNIVWEDTNGDGFFDQEYILNGNSQLRYDRNAIRIAVPVKSPAPPQGQKTRTRFLREQIKGVSDGLKKCQ